MIRPHVHDLREWIGAGHSQEIALTSAAMQALGRKFSGVSSDFNRHRRIIRLARRLEFGRCGR